MFDDHKIKRMLDHRMHSVAALNWALDFRSQWKEVPSIEVYIDGKLRIDGNLNAITNPTLEVGLVHCRALLEFLGLRDDNGTLSQIKKRHRGDVGIEHFKNANGPLKKVDPKAALNRYKGERSEAEEALLQILHVTNKGLAHNTQDLIESPEQSRLIEIACHGIPALMISYFYTPLGLYPPASQITVR